MRKTSLFTAIVMLLGCVLIFSACGGGKTKNNKTPIDAKQVRTAFFNADFAPDINDVLPQSVLAAPEDGTKTESLSGLRNMSAVRPLGANPTGTLVDVDTLVPLANNIIIDHTVDRFNVIRDNIDNTKLEILKSFFTIDENGEVQTFIEEANAWTVHDGSLYKYEEKDGDKILYRYSRQNKYKLSIYADSSYEIYTSNVNENAEDTSENGSYSYYKGAKFIYTEYWKTSMHGNSMNYAEFDETDGTRNGKIVYAYEYNGGKQIGINIFSGDDETAYVYSRDYVNDDIAKYHSDSFVLFEGGASMRYDIYNPAAEDEDTVYNLYLDIQCVGGISKIDMSEQTANGETFPIINGLVLENGEDYPPLYVGLTYDRVLEINEEEVIGDNDELLGVIVSYEWKNTDKLRGTFTFSCDTAVTDIDSLFSEAGSLPPLNDSGITYEADFSFSDHKGSFIGTLDGQRITLNDSLSALTLTYDKMDDIFNGLAAYLETCGTGFDDAPEFPETDTPTPGTEE